MADPRKSPRIEEEHLITVMLIPEERLPDDELVTLSLQATEVSKDGLRFHTFHAIPEQVFLRVDVTLQDPPRSVAATLTIFSGTETSYS